jgi:hypothetical protein
VAVPERVAAAEDDEACACPQQVERAERDRPAKRVGDDVDTVSGHLAHPTHEIVAAVVDRDRSQQRHLLAIARRSRPEHAKAGHPPELERRGPKASGRAVHEQRLAFPYGTFTAPASGRHTCSAPAPDTVNAPMRSPTCNRTHPGPSSSTTPISS